jgi:cytochrome c biogenesis protein CcdA/glutaredoxin
MKKKQNYNLIKKILLLSIIFIFILNISIFTNAQDLNNSDDCLDENGSNQCVVDPNVNNIFPNTNVNQINSQQENQSNNYINDNIICAIYFTGIGCPHCAKIDPFLFEDYLPKHPNLIIIEYEVKNKQENAQYMVQYNSIYNSGYNIPVMIVDKDNIFYYTEIQKNIDSLDFNKNHCELANVVYSDNKDYFKNINLNNIKGKPTIWRENRALEKICDSNLDSNILHNLISSKNIDSILVDINYSFIENKSIEYSQGSKEFKNAVELDGWRFYWNSDTNLIDSNTTIINTQQAECQEHNTISFIKVSLLALADSVNPCALAVLLLMLMSIVVSNPNNKKVILKSGLFFILSVIIMYFIYGLLLIKLFAFLDPIRAVIYKVVAIFAMILGLLEIKDYFNYKPGTIGTEMPLSLRPKMKKFVSKITSPSGAFFLGLFVTVFLLPCTIGPYVIVGSMLSINGIISSIPLLLWYNILFVLPMFLVLILIYQGMKKIEDVQKWKDENIKYLHLIAGIIILLIGILMFFGII